jgi:hypothetical protein
VVVSVGDDVDLLGLAAAWCGYEHLAARVGVADRVGSRVSVERDQVDLGAGREGGADVQGAGQASGDW